MSQIPTEYLSHILDEATYLLKESQDLDKSQFLGDETRKRAFVRSIEIIGEASKQIPDEFRKNNPKIEWRMMAGMRDRLIHGYFGIDYDIVWDVVINKIPDLQLKILKILDQER